MSTPLYSEELARLIALAGNHRSACCTGAGTIVIDFSEEDLQ